MKLILFDFIYTIYVVIITNKLSDEDRRSLPNRDKKISLIIYITKKGDFFTHLKIFTAKVFPRTVLHQNILNHGKQIGHIKAIIPRPE